MRQARPGTAIAVNQAGPNDARERVGVGEARGGGSGQALQGCVVLRLYFRLEAAWQASRYR